MKFDRYLFCFLGVVSAYLDPIRTHWPFRIRIRLGNTGFYFPFYKSILHVCRLRVLLVPRSGLHTSLSLGNEVRVIVCPGFADSISEGDIRYRYHAALSSSNGICNLCLSVKAEWSLSALALPTAYPRVTSGTLQLFPQLRVPVPVPFSNSEWSLSCPGCTDSISEGDIRYPATLSSSNGICNLYPAVKAEWSLSSPGCTDSISEGNIRYGATLSSTNGTGYLYPVSCSKGCVVHWYGLTMIWDRPCTSFRRSDLYLLLFLMHRLI